ncbi:MAG TPA: hypothetical protein VGG05_02305 [Pseudonocardiaceae bacterium]|jgi:serine/threonine protein kinase
MGRLADLSCPDLPPVYFRRAEQRWAEAISDPAAQEVLAGDTILHTDYNPANILITTDGNAKIIDWAWPTKGSARIDPACLIPRLIACGHSPTSAEEVARQCPAWHNADTAAIDLFASALTRLWTGIASDQPDEPWKQALAKSAQQWSEHRSAAVIVQEGSSRSPAKRDSIPTLGDTSFPDDPVLPAAPSHHPKEGAAGVSPNPRTTAYDPLPRTARHPPDRRPRSSSAPAATGTS